MALEFRSSIEEMVCMLERDAVGRERIITAKRDPSVSGVTRWNLEVTHPSGFTKQGTYTGPRAGVGTALDSMLAETRHRFREEGVRGDRPAVELDPLRGSVRLPATPVISMAGGSVRR